MIYKQLSFYFLLTLQNHTVFFPEFYLQVLSTLYTVYINSIFESRAFSYLTIKKKCTALKSCVLRTWMLQILRRKNYTTYLLSFFMILCFVPCLLYSSCPYSQAFLMCLFSLSYCLTVRNHTDCTVCMAFLGGRLNCYTGEKAQFEYASWRSNISSKVTERQMKEKEAKTYYSCE